MAIDIRATVTCSLGTLINGSLSDDYIQGNGLVKTRGSAEISGLITPAVGTVVTFSYTKGGVTRTIPRRLRVLSSFADPFRRTTKVELGCKLTYMGDIREALSWGAFSDPENRNTPREDAKIVTLPIHASSVMATCLAKLRIASSGAVLTNKFSISKFDFSAGYAQVLSDLLVSEGYFGYLDGNDVLQIRSLNAGGGTGPVFTANDIIDLGPINSGGLPGEAVTVSYSTLKLKVPEEPEDGGGGGSGGEEEEDGGIPTEADSPEEAAEQAIINSKKNWERNETYGSEQEYYVGYKTADSDEQKVRVYTGSTSTISETTYKTIRFRLPPQATFGVGSEDLTLVGTVEGLPIYTLLASVPFGFPQGTNLGSYESLSAEDQAEFDASPGTYLSSNFPNASPPDFFDVGLGNKWVLTTGGWQLNPPTYEDRYEDNPVEVLEEVWSDADLYDFIADGQDKWVLLSSGWTLNPPTFAERFEEEPESVLNELWPSANVYDYVSETFSESPPLVDKWIHVGSGQWYYEKQALDEDELYEEKEVPVKTVTTEYGPLIAVASSVATDYLSNGYLFYNEEVTLSETVQSFDYDDYGNEIGSTTRKYENRIKAAAASDLRWADSEERINLDWPKLVGTVLTEEVISTNEILSGYIRNTTSTYLKYVRTQNGQQAVANAVQQASDMTQMANIIAWIIDSELVHKDTATTVSRLGTTTSQERPPSAVRQNAEYSKGSLSNEEKAVKPENRATSGQSPAPSENTTSSDASAPDPNNGYRVENSSELELALGSPAAERRVDFSMPYAPDDTFIKGANGKYYSRPSDAKQKAQAYGRVQNRLLLGNRNGMNLQLAPEKLPEAPFDPMYVQANGLTGLYRANGNQWAFSSDGIVCSTDALFWGGVAGTGTFWFPVAPGVTALPTTPPIVNGQMNATTVVPPFNETVVYSSRIRLRSTVLKFEYALGLLTVVPPLATKARVAVRRVLYGEAGSYVLSGKQASLRKNSKLTAEPGSFTLTGQQAGLFPLRLFADSGAYAFAGQPASLTAPNADPNFSSVSLLLRMNGTNGSTTFTDSSTNAFTVTVSGNAQISTAQAKFGGASGLFDGNGDWLSVANNAAFQFGTGSFTVEAWIYASALTANFPSVVANGNATFTGSGSTGACFMMVTGSPRKVTFGTNTTNPIASSTTTIATGQWYHIAVTRSGSTVRLFVDGNLEGTATNSQNINLSNNSLQIGRNGWDGTAGHWNGYIDDLRITKGVARYTASFTPPALTFANYS